MERTVWRVLSPSGPGDYVTNRLAHLDPSTSGPCTNPATVTAIEAATWDFCGCGPAWSSIGLYPASTALGPTTPDLANPIALATTLSMLPHAADWGYPATVYDFPDVNTSTSSALAGATTLHVTAGWSPGDSCIWIATDTDGTDPMSLDPCRVVPGSVTFFTSDRFNTPATLFALNVMMRVHWH